MIRYLAVAAGLLLFAAPSVLFAKPSACYPGYREPRLAIETGPETTTLADIEAVPYRDWLIRNCVDQRELDYGDYDYQGAYSAHQGLDANGLLPDTFMRHGHVLFSVESQYSMGELDGCHWVYFPDGSEECTVSDNQCEPYDNEVMANCR